MTTIAWLLSRLPLSTLQALGRLLGWIPYLWSPRYRLRLRANLAQAGYGGAEMTKRAVREIGCGALELAFIWMRPLQEVIGHVVEVVGGDVLERARTAGEGIIFLTPHLGCFELASLYVGSRIPLTVLYRPPRMRSLQPLMHRGRVRGFVKTGATDLSGVRKLLRALKAGEAVGLLPDQVPSEGGGVWADFFGRPAYTTTLATRLAESTGARMIMVFCERLPRGRGYILRLHEVPLDAKDQSPARLINREVERLVASQPTQYLWSYNRYKTPASATAPEAVGASATTAAADSSKDV